jgi:hypothetical protein
MNCKFALITSICSVILLFFALKISYAQELIGEDERIIVTVESIKRADTFPNLFYDSKYITYSYETHWTSTSNKSYNPSIPLGFGYDFAIIYLDYIVEKKALYVSDTEFSFTKMYVVDDRGKHHPLKMRQTSGLSPQIDSAYLFFAMPKDAQPTQLKFSYQYREEPSKFRRIKTGQVDVDLLHPRSINQNFQSGHQVRDSISIINGHFYQENIRLGRSTVKNIVKFYPSAYQEVKSGSSRITWGYVLAGCGGILLGGGIGTLIVGETSESLDPATGISVGVAFIAGSYLLIRSGAKKFVNGVQIYNSNLSPGASIDGIVIDFGLTDHGVGFTAKF